MRIVWRLLGALSLVALVACGTASIETERAATEPQGSADPTSIQCPPDDGISGETVFLSHTEPTHISPEDALDNWIAQYPKLNRENFTRENGSEPTDTAEQIRFVYTDAENIRAIVTTVPAGPALEGWEVLGSEMCGSLL